MNWLTGWKKKIGINVKKIFKKQSTGNEEIGDFKNCPQCKKISDNETLIKSFYICECNWHFPLPPKLRLDDLFDSAYEIIEAPKNINSDPLNFVVDGRYTYSDKIKSYRKKTGQETALLAGTGLISGMKAVVAVFNPLFGGGRFGVHENEHFLKIANYAVQEKVEFWDNWSNWHSLVTQWMFWKKPKTGHTIGPMTKTRSSMAQYQSFATRPNHSGVG